MMLRNKQRLSAAERWRRLVALSAVVVAAVLLRGSEPSQIARWWPFATSCGAVTGLPCIFCGGTRALHSILTGDFSRALYFNWIAFPVVAAALAWCALAAAESICGRKLVRCATALVLTPRMISVSLAVLFGLWALQVYLAVSRHKSELLNPRGPLYALFVK
jgi:hypothetical protein